jgi:hypothetical protein
MEKIKNTSNQLDIYQSENFVGTEVNLERIGFFTPTLSNGNEHKTTKVLKRQRTENGRRIITRVAIIPSVDYGRPTAMDLDIHRAFLKILRNILFKEGTVTNPVFFKDEEIIKIMEKARNGKITKAIRLWMARMNSTLIESENFIIEKDDKGKRQMLRRFREGKVH